MACAHSKIAATVQTVRSDENPSKLHIEVGVKCEECQIPFRFGKAFISSTDGLQFTAEILPGPRKINRPLVPAQSMKEIVGETE